MSRLRRFVGAAVLVGAPLGVLILLQAGSSSASPTCDTSWSAAVSGDFLTPGNWTAGVPSSATNACITLAGTYTVSLTGASATAKTLTLGAASGATTQTLAVVGTGCGSPASLTTTTAGSTVKTTGLLDLTADLACSGNTSGLTVNGLTVTGTVKTDPGNGGSRAFSGTMTNSGTFVLNATADLAPGSVFTNQGTVNLADAVTFTGDASTSPTTTSFTNGSGGAVVSSGAGHTGQLVIRPGNAFVEGAGTSSGMPVVVDGSALSYTGSGSSAFIALETGTLTGAPSAGQSLTVEGQGCGPGAAETLSASATNGGTLDLSANLACSGGPASLTVAPGATLTNTGTLQTDPGGGGSRTLTGIFVNSGTVTVNQNTDLAAGSTFTNQGALGVADAITLSLDSSTLPSTTFTNGTGGSISSTGTGHTGQLVVNGGNTFVEGAGTTAGQPVVVNSSALTYSGAGASSIIIHGTGNLTGAPSAGQVLNVQGTGCGIAANETMTGSATNAGTIFMSADLFCSGNADTLTIPSGDRLTNTGTLETDPGNGGTRTILGDINNGVGGGPAGTIKITTPTTLKPNTLFDNFGAVNVTAGSLSIGNKKASVVVNDTGGSMTATAALRVSGGTFRQGNGTVTHAIALTNVTLDFTGTGHGSFTAGNTSNVLEGTLVSGQAYTVEGGGCAKAAAATTSGTVVNGGAITLTANKKCSGNSASLTVPGGSSLTNSGTMSITPGNGGARAIAGNLTNTGTVTVSANATFSGGTWDNKGTITIGDGLGFSAPASSATTFQNDIGGSVHTTGSASTGALVINDGNTFVEGAGTSTGGPMLVVGSALSYTGTGASSIVAEHTGTLTGAPAAGQALSILGTGCGSPAAETLTASATNAGTIDLTADTACSGNGASLTTAPGTTLTTTGSLETHAGGGGGRVLTGSFINQGTATITAATDLATGSSWTNNGAVDIADAISFAVDASTSPTVTTFTNGTGGSVVSSGGLQTGVLFVHSGNAFSEGAGTTSGQPVVVDGSALAYTGTGNSSIVARDSGSLTGASIGSLQTLTVQGTGCGSPATETLAASITNNGTVVLAADNACSGNDATVTLAAGKTFTNNGVLQALNGNGGARTINGNVVNGGTVGPSDGPTLLINGTYTQQSTGTLKLTVPSSTPTLTVNGTATLAGTLGAVPTAGSTFTHGEQFPAIRGTCSGGTCTAINGSFSAVTGGAGQTWTQAPHSAVPPSTPAEVDAEYLAP